MVCRVLQPCRIWAPQVYLAYEYAVLANFANVPAVKAQKAELADQSRRLFKQELELFGQINENTNGVFWNRSVHLSRRRHVIRQGGT